VDATIISLLSSTTVSECRGLDQPPQRGTASAMSTRTIAIVALIVAVVVLIILLA
jgi:hypothetical protein